MKNEVMWTAEALISELEDALRTLSALPRRGPSTRLAQLQLPTLSDGRPPAPEASTRLSLPTPSAAAISRMDRTLAWMSLLPADRFTLRRIVLLRVVTNFASGKPMSWPKIAQAIGADKAALSRWHAQAIEIICRRLNAQRVPAPLAGDH